MTDSSQSVIHGDARVVLPQLELSGSVVITDPPWLGGERTGILGAGPGAHRLWSEVATLLAGARSVVVFQSALEPPFPPVPGMPFVQTCWMRSVPPGYRGRRMMGHLAFVYGDPPLPPGMRCHSAESQSVTTPGAKLDRLETGHPCPMSLQHARWLVRWFGYGCRVVDPFAGAGTVLRAAAELGQPCLGIEADERWVPVAERAIMRANVQGRLFGPTMADR